MCENCDRGRELAVELITEHVAKAVESHQTGDVWYVKAASKVLGTNVQQAGSCINELVYYAVAGVCSTALHHNMSPVELWREILLDMTKAKHGIPNDYNNGEDH